MKKLFILALFILGMCNAPVFGMEHIEKLSESGVDYIPYNDNYTLEIWHDQLGLVKQIEDNTPYLYLDCSDVPMGVYQMILIVNEQIVTQSKLLKI